MKEFKDNLNDILKNFEEHFSDLNETFKEASKKAKTDESTFNKSYNSSVSPLLPQLNTIHGCSVVLYQGKLYWIGQLIKLSDSTIVAIELVSIKERICQEQGHNLGSSPLFITYDEAKGILMKSEIS